MESPEDHALAVDAPAEEASAAADATEDVAPTTEPQVAAAAVAEPVDEAGDVVAASRTPSNGPASLSSQPLSPETSDGEDDQVGEELVATPANARSAPPPAPAGEAPPFQAQEAPIEEESSEAAENGVVAAESAADREAPDAVQDDAIAEGAESESAGITAEAAPLARSAASAAIDETASENAAAVTGDASTGIVSASTVLTDTTAVDAEIAEVAERTTATAEERLAGEAATAAEDEFASDDGTALAALPTSQPLSPQVTVASQPAETPEADNTFPLRALSLGLAVATMIFGGLWWRSRSRA